MVWHYCQYFFCLKIWFDIMMPLGFDKRILRRKCINLIKKIGGKLIAEFRKTDPRWLFWSAYYPCNFGDMIGPFLYKMICNKDPWFATPNSFSTSTVFMSAGSILSLCKENCIVWGSGIINRDDSFPKPWKICSVRGPYSRKRCLQLGYDCPEIYGDPGLLLPKYYYPKNINVKYRLGIIPHFNDYEYVHNKMRDSSPKNILIIDVRYPIELIISNLLSCERVISSSLHGIIMAHSYKVPVSWVTFNKKLEGDGVKFLDHYASLGHYSPTCIENALEKNIDDFMDKSESTIDFDLDKICENLIRVCPFPTS